MATMSELISRNVTRMRLPSWNPHACAVPRPDGPWADIYDVAAGIGGGTPVPVLIGVCDQDNRWEPATPGPCEFGGDGLPHGGTAAWVEIACVHGHAEAGWGCERHLTVARDRVHRGGSARCGRCGHVCPLALRVPATGEAAGPIPWPQVTGG